jgi:hypothetical protein
MRGQALPAISIADPHAATARQSSPSATACASLTLVVTCGVAVLSAVSVGQPDGLEARAALALVSAVAGV